MLLNKKSVLRAVSKQLQRLTTQRNNFTKVLFLRNKQILEKEIDYSEAKFEHPIIKDYIESLKEEGILDGKLEEHHVDAKEHGEHGEHHEEGEHHGEHGEHGEHGHHHHDTVSFFPSYSPTVPVRKWSKQNWTLFQFLLHAYSSNSYLHCSLENIYGLKLNILFFRFLWFYVKYFISSHLFKL
jgi:hypothetical protein